MSSDQVIKPTVTVINPTVTVINPTVTVIMGTNTLMNPTLSILTPTIPRRSAELVRLRKSIEDSLIHSGVDPQQVEHCILGDDEKVCSIGEKRNQLMDMARGKYIAFVDDDDVVTPEYIGRILEAAALDPDVITFKQHATINGVHAIVEFKLGNPNDAFPGDGTVRRNAWHLCAWRKTVAIKSRFPHTSYWEDLNWAKPLWQLRNLREQHIPETLYIYRHDSATTSVGPPKPPIRKHVINPTVTVIMDTVGGHQDQIGDTIKSFLAQDYPFCRLLIFNRHPSPLIIKGLSDEARMRIEIINEQDTYLRPVYQHMANMKAIRTDCWTILDDDDLLEPDHISQLVGFWNTCVDRTADPLSISSMNYMVHYEDSTHPMHFRGWAVTLFERLKPDEVDLCFKLFPPDIMCGSDTWIAGCSYFDRRDFNGKPTYHWDRKGNSHVSQHETNRGDTPVGVFAIIENYWRIKIASRGMTLNPVIL